MSLGLDLVALKSPVARHWKAMELCRMFDPVRKEVVEGYSLAYSVVLGEEETGLPIGMAELVCEMAVATRGLAAWTVQVHRLLRHSLNRLRRVAKAPIHIMHGMNFQM
eukprot:TRINITY_DN7560_c0_g1_i3.p1 TRINITY_DN7560_c0_g1~~TRINITY_DN7560_c0_g1_i3.p1  ORF type:complete len:108 (-),score=1.63 TRINITY_DN7560_c0_g1_i3:114-437(-)